MLSWHGGQASCRCTAGALRGQSGRSAQLAPGPPIQTQNPTRWRPLPDEGSPLPAQKRSGSRTRRPYSVRSGVQGHASQGLAPTYEAIAPIPQASRFCRPHVANTCFVAQVRDLRANNMVPVVIDSARSGLSGGTPLAIAERALIAEVDRCSPAVLVVRSSDVPARSGAFFNRTFYIETEGGDGRMAGTTYCVVPAHIEYHPVRNTPVSVIFYEFDK